MAKGGDKERRSASDLLADWRSAERDSVAAHEAASVAARAVAAAAAAEEAAVDAETAARDATDAAALAKVAAERARAAASQAAEAAQVAATTSEIDQAQADQTRHGRRRSRDEGARPLSLGTGRWVSQGLIRRGARHQVRPRAPQSPPSPRRPRHPAMSQSRSSLTVNHQPTHRDQLGGSLEATPYLLGKIDRSHRGVRNNKRSRPTIGGSKGSLGCVRDHLGQLGFREEPPERVSLAPKAPGRAPLTKATDGLTRPLSDLVESQQNLQGHVLPHREAALRLALFLASPRLIARPLTNDRNVAGVQSSPNFRR